MIRPSRRAILAASVASVAPIHLLAALSPVEAEGFISKIVKDLVSLVESGRPADSQESGFRTLFRDHAAVADVARFVMGRAWREMSEAQQKEFESAFVDYVAKVYVKLLSRYDGQTIEVTGSQDFGKKGVVVFSLARGTEVEATKVEWRVSDRTGSWAYRPETSA